MWQDSRGKPARQKSQDCKAGTGQPGQDSQDRTARTEQSGQDSGTARQVQDSGTGRPEKTTRIVQSGANIGHEDQNLIAKTRQLGQDNKYGITIVL